MTEAEKFIERNLIHIFLFGWCLGLTNIRLFIYPSFAIVQILRQRLSCAQIFYFLFNSSK